MPTKSKPPARSPAKLPGAIKARVLYVSPGHYDHAVVSCFDKPRMSPPWHEPRDAKNFIPGVFLPTRTARQVAGFWNKSYADKVEFVAKAIWRQHRDCAPAQTGFLATQWGQLPEWGREMRRNEARAVLAAIGFEEDSR